MDREVESTVKRTESHKAGQLRFKSQLGHIDGKRQEIGKQDFTLNKMHSINNFCSSYETRNVSNWSSNQALLRQKKKDQHNRVHNLQNQNLLQVKKQNVMDAIDKLSHRNLAKGVLTQGVERMSANDESLFSQPSHANGKDGEAFIESGRLSMNSHLQNNSFLIFDYQETNDPQAQPKAKESQRKVLRSNKKTFLLNHQNEPIFETMNRMQKRNLSLKPYSRNTTNPSLTIDAQEHSITHHKSVAKHQSTKSKHPNQSAFSDLKLKTEGEGNQAASYFDSPNFDFDMAINQELLTANLYNKKTLKQRNKSLAPQIESIRQHFNLMESIHDRSQQSEAQFARDDSTLINKFLRQVSQRQPKEVMQKAKSKQARSPKVKLDPVKNYIQSYNSYINEHSELPVIARHRNEQQLFNVLYNAKNEILNSERFQTLVSDPKSSTFFEQFGTVITDQALIKQAQGTSNPSKYIAAAMREIEPLLPASLKKGLQAGKGTRQAPGLAKDRSTQMAKTLDPSALDQQIKDVLNTQGKRSDIDQGSRVEDNLSRGKSSKLEDKEVSGSQRPKDKDTIENPPSEERSLKQSTSTWSNSIRRRKFSGKMWAKTVTGTSLRVHEAANDPHLEKLLRTAMAQCNFADEIDQSLLSELRLLKTRFLDDSHLRQIELVELKNNILQDSKEFEVQIRKLQQEMGQAPVVVPGLQQVWKDGKNFGEARIQDYESKLEELEKVVIKEMVRFPADITNSHFSKAKRSPDRHKSPGRRSGKGAAAQHSADTPLYDDQIKVISKSQIMRNLMVWKNQYMLQLLQNGTKMAGNNAGFDFDQLSFAQQSRLIKVMNFEHERQQDLLVYRLHKSLESGTRQSKAQAISLPSIVKPTHTATDLPITEQAFRNRFSQIIGEHMKSFVSKQEEEIEALINLFITDSMKKSDPKYQELAHVVNEHSASLPFHMRRSEEFTELQEQVLKEHLINELTKAMELPLDSDSRLMAVAMVENAAPDADHEDIVQQELEKYTAELKAKMERGILQRPSLYREGGEEVGASPFALALHDKVSGETGMQSHHLGDLPSSSLPSAFQTVPQNRTFFSNKYNYEMRTTTGSPGERPESSSVSTSNIDKQKLKAMTASASATDQDQHPTYVKEVTALKIFRHNNIDPKFVMDGIANQLISKYRSLQAKKQSVSNQKAAQKFEKVPFIVYFKECLQEHDIVLPVLDTVQHGHLSLQNYLLRTAHCKALMKALHMSKKQDNQLFNSVTLRRNTLKDEDLTMIVKGLNQQNYIKKLQITENEVGLKSITEIMHLVSRRKPYQLKHLILVDCRMSSQAIDSLLAGLNNRSNLYFLSLAKMTVTEPQLGELIQFLSTSVSLRKLSLQWCSLKQQTQDGFMPLLECLGKNRRIRNINLAWTNLVDMNKGYKKQDTFILQQQEAAENIICLFKYNKKLMHLDLSNTGITKMMFDLIAQNMKKAMSLLSIHLSGNPFIREIDDYPALATALRAKPILDPKQIAYFKEQLEVTRPIDKREMFVLNAIKAKQKLNQQSIRVDGPLSQQQFILQRKLGHKPDIPLAGQWEILKDQLDPVAYMNDDLDDKNVYNEASRVKKYCNCWYCGGYQYTIIFWSESIQFAINNGDRKLQRDYSDAYGKHLMAQPEAAALHAAARHKEPTGTGPALNTSLSLRLSQIGGDSSVPNTKSEKEEKKEATGGASRMSGDDSSSSDVESSDSLKSELSSSQVPIIYTEGSHWKPAQMVEVFSHIKQVDPSQFETEDFLQKLKDQGRIPADVKSKAYLNKMQRRWYHNEKMQHEHQMRRKWLNIIISKSQYKKPLLINAEEAFRAVKRKQLVFMHACFLKPGKHSIFVTSRDEYSPDAVEKSIQTFMVGVREEPIPLVVKMSNKQVQERQFKKESSVFAQWRKDDKSHVIQILDNHDFLKWKVHRFVKDEAEIERVKDFMRRHIADLKEIYAHLQSESQSYPGVSQLTFSYFCQQCGMVDKAFNLSSVDRLFISAIFNDGRSDALNAKEMLRFQFLEILVRIARTKYMETGQASSYETALDKLFDEHLSQHTPTQAWQRWREQELWTLPINDMYNFNLDTLRKLYTTAISEYKGRKMSFADALTMFLFRYDFKIGERVVKYCYGMSKMTIINEDYQRDRYYLLDFVEFLEMIGRIALVKYEGSDMEREPLVRKIEFVVDSLFTLLNVERSEVVLEEEDISDSDPDY